MIIHDDVWLYVMYVMYVMYMYNVPHNIYK